MKITHQKRMKTTLSGERPDRIPVALWHHFPVDDQDPNDLATATIAFQKQFDFDFVKVSPPSSFCLKDWGAKDKWLGNTEGTRFYTDRVIQRPEDWYSLKILDPYKGYLGKQLQCLARLQETFSDHTPFIQTIFNPLSQVKNLIGPEKLTTHLRRYPDALHHGLKAIQETSIRFIEAAKTFGISGIFFAIQHASYQILTEDEYRSFGVAYDLPVLKAANELWLNMAHLHGDSLMFSLVENYPVQILNWHDRETLPTLAKGLKQFPGVVCGGIGRIESLVLGTPDKVKLEARQAVEQTGGKRLILGTGCVLPLNAPFGNIKALREVVRELQ